MTLDSIDTSQLSTRTNPTKAVPRALGSGVPWMLGATATLLALLGSWIPSLWGDEAASVLSARRSIPSLFRMLGHVDAVHGTYYLALHFWVDLVGTSPFAVRLPSAIAVGLGAVAVVLLAGRLSGPRVAIIAGLVYCVLPRVTYMGEEARAYAFDAAIAAWGLVLLVDLIRGRRRGRIWWVAYAALVTFGIYAFLYLGLFVAVHAVILFGSRASRAMWRRWAISTVAAIGIASPVAVASILERSQIAFLATRNTTGFASLAVGVFFWDWWVAVPAWTLIALAAASWVRGRRSRQAGSRASARPSVEIVAFAWLLIPGALLLASNVAVPDFSGRYLSMSAPGAALAVALGIDRLARRRPGVGIAASALMIALCVPAYVAQRTPYAKNQSDWAEISATVKAHARSGEAVVFDEGARPSRRPRLAYRTYASGFAGLADVTLETPFWRSASWHDSALPVASAISRGAFDGYRTVWLIEYASPSHIDSYGRSELGSDGYAVSATYRTHRSAILELTKATSR